MNRYFVVNNFKKIDGWVIEVKSTLSVALRKYGNNDYGKYQKLKEIELNLNLGFEKRSQILNDLISQAKQIIGEEKLYISEELIDMLK